MRIKPEPNQEEVSKKRRIEKNRRIKKIMAR